MSGGEHALGANRGEIKRGLGARQIMQSLFVFPDPMRELHRIADPAHHPRERPGVQCGAMGNQDSEKVSRDLRRHKILVWVLIAALAIIIAVSVSRLAYVMNHQPQFGWVKSGSQALVVAVGGQTSFGPILGAGSLLTLRYDVTSTLPVSVGVSAEPNPVSSTDLGCYQSHVLSMHGSCALKVQAGYIHVLDLRNPNDLAPAATAIIGAKKPLEDQLARNTVRLEIYTWQCVANCPKP
jgi:hypothetical protein